VNTSASFWHLLDGCTIEEKYRLDSLLGEGSFGGVFRANELVGNEIIGQVAIKLIRPHQQVPARKQLDELRLARQLDHASILRCLSVGQFSMQNILFCYMVMELASESLKQRIVMQPLSTVEVKQMAKQLAEALIYLQERNPPLVHRDIKPANIMRVGSHWKLADFGVARTVEGTMQEATSIGTQYYMPPEGFNGEVSPAWDVWSLGVTLCETLTGKHPFADGATHPIHAILSMEPQISPNIPVPFNAVIRGCLIKDRRQRWTASRVLEVLNGQLPVQISSTTPSVRQPSIGEKQSVPQKAIPPNRTSYPSKPASVTSTMPSDMSKWNWGAFSLAPFWGFAMKTWWAWVWLICPYVSFYLGFKGNEIAWSSRKWRDEDEFREVQTKWSKWGLAFFCLSLIIEIIVLLYRFGGASKA